MSGTCSRIHKPIIGIAGGIGAGKSVVARAFGALGAAIIDADRLAHEELRCADVLNTLCAWWGNKVRAVDGSPDHRTIASIVFSDPVQLARLEGLLYPRLSKRMDRMIADLQENAGVTAVVVDAPKLFEAGLDRRCDAVVFVDADREVRRRRVAASRGWDEQELARRENLQNGLDKKRERADYVVTNHAGIEDLRPQVERVLSSIQASVSR